MKEVIFQSLEKSGKEEIKEWMKKNLFLISEINIFLQRKREIEQFSEEKIVDKVSLNQKKYI